MRTKLFVSFVVINALLIPVSQAITFGENKCTLLSCPGISRDKIEDLKQGDLKNIFFEDSDNRQAFSQKFSDERFWRSEEITFDEWYPKAFEKEEETFRSTQLKYANAAIEDLEKKFEVKLNDEDFLGKYFNQEDELREIARNKGVCKLAVKEEKRFKECRSHRRSCGGQLAYILTAGFFGSPNCRAAYAYCHYYQSWNLLLRSERGHQSVISNGSLSIRSEVDKGEYHMILLPLALEAKKDFKAQEKSLKKILGSIPKCN